MLAVSAVPLVLGSLLAWRVNVDFTALATPFGLAKQKLAEHAIELPKGRGTIPGYDTSPMNILVRADGEIVDLHIPAGRYSSNYILMVGLVALPMEPSKRPTSGLLGLVGSDLPAYQVLHEYLVLTAVREAIEEALRNAPKQ